MDGKIVVTGVGGYVAGFVVTRLLEDGHSVRAASRAEITHQEQRVEYYTTGDLGGADDLRPLLLGAKAVIHLAGRAHVFHEKSGDPEAAYQRANRVATKKLASAAAMEGVERFVLVSTVKVNGEASERGIDQNSAVAPDDAYGRSKRDAEFELAQIAARSSMTATVVRPTMVYGPACTGNVRRLSRFIMRGIPLPLGSIKNRRSMIYVRNLADILVKSATDPRAAGQTYVAAEPKAISTPDLIRHLAKGLGVTPRLLPFPPAILSTLGKAFGIGPEISRLTNSFVADPSHLERTLDWKPRFDMEEALIETGRSFRPSGQ